MRFPIPDGQLSFEPHWLPRAEADELLAEVMDTVRWETHRIRMFGREVDSPRLSCWIGDAGASYVYSRTRFEPRPWPPALQALRARVDAAAGVVMNSVLANLYRDGKDAMGWHSDDEPELGPRPMIASLSLGGTRRFSFKHRHDASKRFALDLPHGSLLLMSGDTQANWRHALPRTARAVAPRLNLTFRRIEVPPT
ncbi:alpha-ketoglutarate-dependent dioxygenase AlkB family protein [Arenimonas alkanexedens]